MDDNKRFWQRVSRVYAPFMRSSQPLYEGIAARVLPYLGKEMKVLELACGTGQLSFLLSEQAALWEATDFSENMIAEAVKKQGNGVSLLHFAVQDATALPYTAGSFDAVVIANALHIMPQPERAMREIERVLKIGGLLFAPTFLHGEGVGFRLRVRMMSLIGFRTYSKWSAEALVRFVGQFGFVVKEQSVMGSKLTPLCCLIAEKRLDIGE